MRMRDDRLAFWFGRWDEAPRGDEAWRPMLERLEASFLPRPTSVFVDGAKPKKASSWLDKPVLKELARARGTNLEGPGLLARLSSNRGRSVLALWFDEWPSNAEAVQLFVDLCRRLSPDYAFGHPDQHTRRFAAAHPVPRRTTQASSLWWLTFFGPAEEAQQGGPALAQNPHARAERFPEGLLLEVGDPLEAVTPTGEQRLLDATRALPPTLPQPAGPVVEVTTVPAELTELGGVRGFVEGATFWVPKHVDASQPLDARTVAQLAAVKRGLKAPLEFVIALFSDEAAAKANAGALSVVGVGAWCLDPETARPRPLR